MLLLAHLHGAPATQTYQAVISDDLIVVANDMPVAQLLQDVPLALEVPKFCWISAEYHLDGDKVTMPASLVHLQAHVNIRPCLVCMAVCTYKQPMQVL